MILREYVILSFVLEEVILTVFFTFLFLWYQEEKKRKREKEQCDTEGETDDFDPGKKVEVEPPSDRPVRACRTQPGALSVTSETDVPYIKICIA